MDWLAEFPSLGKRDLRDLKKGIDGSFREWSRSNEDFDFNQDNAIEFNEEFRSPGWNRFKKNKMLKWKK